MNIICDYYILLGLIYGVARESKEEKYYRTSNSVLEIGKDLDKGSQLIIE